MTGEESALAKFAYASGDFFGGLYLRLSDSLAGLLKIVGITVPILGPLLALLLIVAVIKQWGWIFLVAIVALALLFFLRSQGVVP